VPEAQHSVLIVDDEPDIRDSLTAVLEAEGYTVMEAEHGEEALRRLRASPDAICIILLDLYMPTMNGWTFRNQQLSDPSLASIPVIVITADAAAARKARQLGVIGAMTKPLDLDQLLQLIAAHC